MEKGIELYTMAINKFLGNSIISRLEQVDGDIRKLAPESTKEGQGDWVDLCGLIVPKVSLVPILEELENGQILSTEALNRRLASLHHKYYDLEWQWAYLTILEFYGLSENEITDPLCLTHIIEQWRDSVVRLDRMLWEDARKEFSLSARTGFGFDGKGNETQSMDFSQVRGQFDSNPFVKAVEEHICTKSALADKWIRTLSQQQQ